MPSQLTAEEASRLNPPDRWELVQGEIVFMSPAGFRHGEMVARVAQALREFVTAQHLGVVLAGDPGFVLRRDPDTVRAPDSAFMTAARVPSPMPAEFFVGFPDLAVEILSPGDRWPEVERKAADFLAAGSHAVWALDPGAPLARIFDVQGVRTVPDDGSLEAPRILPGFTLPLSRLFG